MKIVDGITAAMAQADPERAHIYYSNGEEYKARLAALDAEIRGTVDAFKRKKFVAFHSAWVYFARRYGLEQAAVIEPFPGRGPSPRSLAEVVRIARDIGAKAIFAEPQLNPKAAKIIAKEVGIEVLYLDPMGDPRLHERSGYLELMRYNTSVFRRALHD